MKRRTNGRPSRPLPALAAAAVLALLCAPAQAQRMAAGIVVGRALTGGFHDLRADYFLPPLEPGGSWYRGSARFWPRSRDWVAGAMLEVRLNSRWSLEANALFRELRGQHASFLLPAAPPKEGSPEQIVTWQFPVLAKYRFQGRNRTPFLAVGPALRTIGNVGGSHHYSRHGMAVSSGLEVNWRAIKFAPTIRYTLWAGDKSTSLWRTASDQLEVLVAVSRGSEQNWRPLGERVCLGFAAGVNLNGDYPEKREVYQRLPDPASSYLVVTSGATSAIYGPTVEVSLRDGLSVEAAALHRPIALKQQTISPQWSVPTHTGRLVTWVFPVLAKYSFSRRGVSPFLALGPSFRIRQFFKETSPYGATAAAGLRMRAGPLKITPTLRFTRWGENRLPGWPRRNQLEALVGFSF